MSNTDPAPEVTECEAPDVASRQLLLEPRKVWLGKTTLVRRLLPHADIRMIGAWCFLDHYGPEDVSASRGMLVPPHPHTGLQTVSWLFGGEILHRDGLGSKAVVRPGELNVMTAGPGIAHSEESPADHPPVLHGVQLWVALPDPDRETVPPAFDQHTDLPHLARPGLRGVVMVGTLDDVTSPVVSHTPLVAADLTLEPGADLVLPLRSDLEHGVLAVLGEVTADDTEVGTTHLLYLGPGRSGVRLRTASGARLLLLGGAPFTEDLVMWWNFVGRSHEEIERYRQAWVDADPRFAPVLSFPGERLPAPPLPSVRLKARRRNRLD